MRCSTAVQLVWPFQMPGRIIACERAFVRRGLARQHCGGANVALDMPCRIGTVPAPTQSSRNTAYGPLAHLSRPVCASSGLPRCCAGVLALRISANGAPEEISRRALGVQALARALVTDPWRAPRSTSFSRGFWNALTKSKILNDLRCWESAHLRIPILYVTHAREEVLALGCERVCWCNGRRPNRGAGNAWLRCWALRSSKAWRS